MSSIIRVRRGDMVVSFRRCSDGLLHVRRFERITLLPTQAARPTSSAQPFRPTPLPAPEGVVPKKPRALIQVCFSGQTVEVGLEVDDRQGGLLEILEEHHVRSEN